MPINAVIGPIIAAGQSLSSVLDLSTTNRGVLRLVMPDDWTDAWLTVLVSPDNVDYHPLVHPDGRPYTITVRPDASVAVDTDVARLAFFKLLSGTVDAPVNQTATRTFTTIVE